MVEKQSLSWQQRLQNTLAQTESYWSHLLQGTANPQLLSTLSSMAAELAQAGRQHHLSEFAKLARELENSFRTYVGSSQEAQIQLRGQITALLSKLRRLEHDLFDHDGLEQSLTEALSMDHAPDHTIRSSVSARRDQSTSAGAGAEIWLLAAQEDSALSGRLTSAGFELRYINGLSELEILLEQAVPTALIADCDWPDDAPYTGRGLLARIGELTESVLPLIVLSEKDDFKLRLEAVQSGSTHYFTKPFNKRELLDKLYDLTHGQPNRQYRVLIVSENPTEAQAFSELIDAEGILTQTVRQAERMLDALERWQPDLLLLDLDLHTSSGAELVKVIRQHQDFCNIYLLTLSSRADLSRRLSASAPGGHDTLLKPLTNEELLSAIDYGLLRARALTNTLNKFKYKDPSSGLYNQMHFLKRLEHAVNALDNSFQSVAVMIVVLDNLRIVTSALDPLLVNQVLQQAARRLLDIPSIDSDTARYSDAGFALLFTDTNPSMLLSTARSIRKVLENDNYHAGEHTFQLRINIGISITHRHDNQDFLKLVQHADLACTIAREREVDHIHIYENSAENQSSTEKNPPAAIEIKEALDSKRFKLLYQPIVSLQSDATERYEVLLRVYNQQGAELSTEKRAGLCRALRIEQCSGSLGHPPCSETAQTTSTTPRRYPIVHQYHADYAE